MYSLQRVHPQSLVHSRRVGKECSQRGFEDQTEVESPVAHALVDDRVTARLANDQISPLHHHDGDEESGVAGELESLAVAVGLEIGEEQLSSDEHIKMEH